MTITLHTDAAMQVLTILQCEPSLVRQGDDALLDNCQVTLDLLLMAAEAQLESIPQHDEQKP